MKLEHIGFYGLGLIGGSISKAIKKVYPGAALIASSAHSTTVAEAYEAGIIENDELLPPEAFTACDLIFLCAPVTENVRFLEKLSQLPLRPGTIITDVGSVKGTIHEAATALELTHCFIGGHPMAGSEKTGFKNGTPSLLENAYYLITPEKDVPKSEVQTFRALVKSLGAIPMVLDAASHDTATACISHLPHVIAASLVQLVRDSDDEEETMKRIAAGGFRDITRIASSSPEMWESICLSNRDTLLKVMDRYTTLLSDIRETLASGSGEDIKSFFSEAKNYRDSLQVRSKTAMVYELYCDLDDKEGQIALITTILAISHINLKNIGILHNREYEQGVLRIEFYDSASLEKAYALLKSYDYTLYLR